MRHSSLLDSQSRWLKVFVYFEPGMRQFFQILRISCSESLKIPIEPILSSEFPIQDLQLNLLWWHTENPIQGPYVATIILAQLRRQEPTQHVLYNLVIPANGIAAILVRQFRYGQPRWRATFESHKRRNELVDAERNHPLRTGVSLGFIIGRLVPQIGDNLTISENVGQSVC